MAGAIAIYCVYLYKDTKLAISRCYSHKCNDTCMTHEAALDFSPSCAALLLLQSE